MARYEGLSTPVIAGPAEIAPVVVSYEAVPIPLPPPSAEVYVPSSSCRGVRGREPAMGAGSGAGRGEPGSAGATVRAAPANRAPRTVRRLVAWFMRGTSCGGRLHRMHQPP